jgi:hypothetical protein
MISRSAEKKIPRHRKFRSPSPTTEHEIAPIMGGLYGDGVIGFKGAFPRDWVRQMGEEITTLYREALAPRFRLHPDGSPKA